MTTFFYRHPELTTPWIVATSNFDAAKQRFEDCWHLRVANGLLDHVNGSFFDGRIGQEESDIEDNLCPDDLQDHFWVDDERDARREFVSDTLQRHSKPVLCILCQTAAWLPRAAKR
jgi:hypothetical protein